MATTQNVVAFIEGTVEPGEKKEDALFGANWADFCF